MIFYLDDKLGFWKEWYTTDNGDFLIGLVSDLPMKLFTIPRLDLIYHCEP